MIEKLTADDQAALLKISEANSLPFSEKVKMLGLNPKFDFQHSDLQKVNFNGSNLCEYNFLGSDLRGSYGNDIKFDESTDFTNCDLDDSPFLFSSLTKNVFQNPDWNKRYNRLIHADVIDKAIYISEAGNAERTTEKRRQVASVLLHNSNDAFLQKIGLSTLLKLTGGKCTQLSYMKSVLAKRQEKSTIIAATIKNLGILYKNNEDVFQILQNFLLDQRLNVALENMRAMNKSSFRHKYKNQVSKIVTSNDWSQLRGNIVKNNLEKEILVYVPEKIYEDNLQYWVPDPVARIDISILDRSRVVSWQPLMATAPIFHNHRFIKELVSVDESYRRARIRNFFFKTSSTF